MKGQLGILILCAAIIGGCGNREEELQQQLGQAREKQRSLEQTLAERDRYVADVVKTVNEVYAGLEEARVKEAGIVARSGGAEGTQVGNVDTRQKLLQNISEIGSGLKESRKKISALQGRMKSFRGEIAGMNSLIGNLKQSLQERETSIAQLEERVQGLETAVTEKDRMIAERENQLGEQQRKINTGFYIIGSRDELKEKGIITDEGGFLWGLLGSTTVMASGIDVSQFRPIDKTADQTITVPGTIEEILPHRKAEAFVTAEPAEQQENSTLTIVHPDQFWQDDYLVIIVD
jgi:hypothetical protein